MVSIFGFGAAVALTVTLRVGSAFGTDMATSSLRT
jgi:hypothetical protein